MSDLDTLMKRHYELGYVLRERMLACSKKDDISIHQLQALMFIDEHENPRMSELAHFAGISSSSATARIARLEKSGWVRRVHDARNRTVVRVHLTPAGRHYMETSVASKQAVFREIFSHLPASDVRELSRILTDLLLTLRSSSPSSSRS